MLKLVGVTKTFGDVNVLHQVHLELKRGDFIYLVGGSGAGKSTLLRMLATEETPSEGSVSVFGYDLSQVNDTTLQAIRRLVGYIPQKVRLIPDLTVGENIGLSLSIAGKRDIKKRVIEILDRLNLAHKVNALAGGLSGGESQRVAVARALVRQPELIIADEPTGAQDHDNTWALMDLISKANLAGATTVLATHDREIVRRVRKRCAILKGGTLAIEGAGSAVQVSL